MGLILSCRRQPHGFVWLFVCCGSGPFLVLFRCFLCWRNANLAGRFACRRFCRVSFVVFVFSWFASFVKPKGFILLHFRRLFFCASSLLCFSMNGSFRIGSEASAHADWVFISAIRRVQDSKCNLLRIAVVPNVDWVSKTASANLVNSSSETGFCGLPKAKASVEKEPMFWPCSFSKSPSCSSSHCFWKAASCWWTLVRHFGGHRPC